MSTLPGRVRIANTIFICHLILIGALIFFLITDALLIEEFTPLLTLLAPVMAIYGGSASRFLANSIRGKQDAAAEQPMLHTDLVRRLVLWHFALMLFLLIAKTVFNWIEFSTLTLLMTLLEVSFGGYMGTVMSAVFEEK